LSLLYIPCGSEADAAELAGALISERLVACANIHSTRSIYRWEGKTVNETEFVLVCKTTPELARAAAARAEALHKYEVPCVLTIDCATANARYLDWVRSEVSGAERGTVIAEHKDGRG
jgi:periplasmic divalent cation tolerance protein